MDPRVEAIRNDKRFGRNTMSTLDECWEDSEIVRHLDTLGITTKRDALKWAREYEGLVADRAADMGAEW